MFGLCFRRGGSASFSSSSTSGRRCRTTLWWGAAHRHTSTVKTFQTDVDGAAVRLCSLTRERLVMNFPTTRCHYRLNAFVDISFELMSSGSGIKPVIFSRRRCCSTGCWKPAAILQTSDRTTQRGRWSRSGTRSRWGCDPAVFGEAIGMRSSLLWLCCRASSACRTSMKRSSGWSRGRTRRVSKT